MKKGKRGIASLTDCIRRNDRKGIYGQAKQANGHDCTKKHFDGHLLANSAASAGLDYFIGEKFLGLYKCASAPVTQDRDTGAGDEEAKYKYKLPSVTAVDGKTLPGMTSEDPQNRALGTTANGCEWLDQY